MTASAAERRPAGETWAASKGNNTYHLEGIEPAHVSSRLIDDARLAHFHARVLADCLSEATSAFWERRARDFEDAAPRVGDWHGNASEAALEAARERCVATAAACRARASLEGPGLPIPALVVAELAGVFE